MQQPTNETVHRLNRDEWWESVREALDDLDPEQASFLPGRKPPSGSRSRRRTLAQSGTEECGGHYGDAVGAAVGDRAGGDNEGVGEPAAYALG